MEFVQAVKAEGPSHPAFDGCRVFSHRDRISRFLSGEGASIVPVTVELWPSLSCNARCPSCPFRVSGARQEADSEDNLFLMDVELARAIIADLALAGVQSIILTGGGEPLLHPRLLEIVDAIRSNGMSWGLFTNGLLLDDKLARQLLERHPRFFRVSVDAGTATLYHQTYAVPAKSFDQLVQTIVGASRVAAELRSRSFGLSFTLSQDTLPRELGAVAALLQRIFVESPGGIGLVAFRPRIIHYKNGKPLSPQPRPAGYLSLTAGIARRIVEPLAVQSAQQRIRMDVKAGLFALAASPSLQTRSFGSAWMTNIDHLGFGYATTELAGYEPSGQRWGRMEAPGDFERAWFGKTRLDLYGRLARGDVPVPLAHRTSPIDAMLTGLLERVGGYMKPDEACELVDAVCAEVDLKPSNTDFV